MEQLVLNTSLLPYNNIPADIHTLLFKHLLKDFSDTTAIRCAKQLSGTCKTQYKVLSNLIKKKFETFICFRHNLYESKINDPLNNFFITMLPAEYYPSLIQRIESEKSTIIKVLEFFYTQPNVNEQEFETLKTYAATIQNDIASVKSQLIEKKLAQRLVWMQEEKLLSIQDKIKAKSTLFKNCCQFHKINFPKIFSERCINTRDFAIWIQFTLKLVYLFYSRKLLQPLLSTDIFYNEYIKLILNPNKKKIFLESIQEGVPNQYKTMVYVYADDIISKHANCPDPRISEYFFTSTIQLPPYIYILNNKTLGINLNWINGLYKHKKENYQYTSKFFRWIKHSEVKEKNNIELRFYTACHMEYNMHKLIEYINNSNPARTAVTITTVDGLDHFLPYNKHFLECLQINLYPNITFTLQVPKQKEHETKTFFNKKPWLIYLNQSIHTGPGTFTKFFFDEKKHHLTGFKTRAFFLTIFFLFLAITQENQSPILLFSSLLPILQLLGFIGGTADEGSFVKYTVGIIPWYILHALLRDTLYIYAIYKYHTINYLLTAYAILELSYVQQSLFYKPLFESIYQQRKAKNTIIISTY